MCKKCSKDGFHVVDASFDADVATIEGQKEVRQKIIDFSMAEDVDIERWVDRFDAVIPRAKHVVMNLSRSMSICDGLAVDYLTTEFYDPDLQQRVTQIARLRSMHKEYFHTQIMSDNLLDPSTKLKDFEDGDVVITIHYVKNGHVLDPNAGEDINPKFLRKPRDLSNVVFLEDRKKESSFPEDDMPAPTPSKISWIPSMITVGIIVTVFSTIIYAIT